MKERFEALEADFQRFYQLDLRRELFVNHGADMYDPKTRQRKFVKGIGVRRLWALVSNLPPESATMRDPRGWTLEDDLLAVIAERLDYWGRTHAQQWGARESVLPKQIIIKRPEHEQQRQSASSGRQPHPKKKVVTDVATIAAWFSQN